MRKLTIILGLAMLLALGVPYGAVAQPVTEVKKLTASDAEGADEFGNSAALSGDIAVVGAYYEDAGGTNAGAAYVFQRNAGGADNWGEVKKLTASDAEGADEFGNSVALSGDIAVVGALFEDDWGDRAGAAYVFQRNAGGADNWGEVKKLTASDAEAVDHFGASVALSGDIAVVGAHTEDTGGSDAGAAYVFQRNAGGADNWGEVKKLTASDAEAEDLFGASAAVSGDIAVVGAVTEDTGGNNAGAAYVFQRDAGGADNWGEVKKLTASDADEYEWFGASVAVSGDIAVVGAELEDAGGSSDRGAAYVFGPPQQLGDTHYQCYDIFPPQPLGPTELILETQFGPDFVAVGPSAQLCAPAIKNGEGSLLDPHLKCYDIAGQDPDVVVNLTTQFGEEQNVQVGRAIKLCLGASKEVVAPTRFCCGFCPQYPMCFDTTDFLLCEHYGCAPLPDATCLDPLGMCDMIPPPQPWEDLYYECFDISATGHDPLDVVGTLQDQFGLKFEVDVGPAELLCAPALVEFMGTLDAPHLKCYQIAPLFPGEYWMILETYFGFEYDVMLGESRWLCTEALKEIVECIDREGDTQCDEPATDPDDDGCTNVEETALGDNFDPDAWYDVYDVTVPAKADAAGANGMRNKVVDIGDVLAVLFYAFADDDGPPNANGVDYDSIKGWDGDGDSVNDASPIHDIEEGLKYDRSPGLGPSGDTGIDPAGAPNGAIDIGDVLAALAQAFQVDCTAP